jgi:glycosyltransferase involved in cell wall biosynthesis
MPQFCDDLEILFVEGHSSDGTYEEINRVIKKYPEHDIKVIKQTGSGKADATFMGFDEARGSVLMILDGDLTVPPEDLEKFWQAIVTGKGEYIQGTRLVYPMEGDAMRFLNLLANWGFSLIFTWLLNQRFTDTLCGTKVLLKSDYKKLKRERDYFEGRDPFGDFDLLFCSSKLNLKMIEIPIYYRARKYGTTQIQRFRNGWQLLKLVLLGYKKLKAL